MMGKVDHKFLKNVKVITGALLHNLVVFDVDKKQEKIKYIGSLSV